VALVVKQTRRLKHPTEPDAWVVVRTPLSGGDMAACGDANNIAELKLYAVALSLQEWSYEGPITRETVGTLDVETFKWLADLVFDEAKLREEDEKNASGSSSDPTTDPGVERSPLNSGI